MRAMLSAICLCSATLTFAQDATVTQATGGELRVLDKLTGAVVDMTLRTGETGVIGYLEVTLVACRYPTDNPSGDAYAQVDIYYQNGSAPIFSGWMLASSPALNALDHPRYDVWALRCNTS
ncbi:DUF2155 domain-containing protein [Yoonia sediminilitoris]|uniref:Uncharacterized protein DUF2155 n=1 Tax=Yoonia sediminilitoris TaxID=1286148 RepID=A0A2T6KQP8_9RHOB|nr:DUF2155 domain-containing protein [Yoonia sediminilitoris]PUB18878.1 uncharacterized protein DUF2155 [Yoonia sediminilitoris]RCW99046.1 uncharacterized protein DUF2155 [Yoonia sediminilitoris]